MKLHLLLPFVAAVSLWGAEVLLNDPMTAGVKDNVPIGWKPYRQAVDGSSGKILAGDGCITVVDEGPGEIGFCRDFPVKPGMWLRASAEVRQAEGETVKSLCRIQLTARMQKEQRLATQFQRLSRAFKPYSVGMRVPEGCKVVRLYVYSGKKESGKIDIRNIKMESSDTELKELTIANRVIDGNTVFKASIAELNPKTTVLTQAERADDGRAAIITGSSNVKNKEAAPDMVFTVIAPSAGLYVLRTEASVDAEGAKIMENTHSKFGSMYARIQIGSQRPTERVVFVPWGNPLLNAQTLGKFELAEGEQKIKFWLPEHLKLHKMIAFPYTPVKVPPEVEAYSPAVVPPPVHPRLWVTPDLLPTIRQNLETEENRPHWEAVKLSALAPLEFKFNPDEEIPFNAPLEVGILNKAFYYLMTGDKTIGQEALKLAVDYISHVEFGNLLDITREMGRAIYVTSCTYDWCFDLMTDEQRETILQHFKRLRRDMECGWPPFGQSILNGHGNERQVNRDLLSMSIAIYGEDPEPYKYCAYKILEQLVPMRKWEYQSSRHNQGISYSSFRFQCDMHAATLFKRMLGREVFDPNIKNMPYYWLYMRAPNGAMLRDGDGVCNGDYWSMALTNLFNFSYSGNPLVKGEFVRQKGLSTSEHIYFLLLNRPEIKPEMSLDSLPWTHDFGPILSSMVARTGWNLGKLSDDVVAEIKGGGFHSGNHQHADAGSFQVFYRGWLVAKLDQYGFYGTPYDMNFNKRSIAKSMMLVRDPNEKFLNTAGNDGGSRFLQRHPTSPEMAQSDPTYHYGKKLSCSFGPSPMRPLYSYYAADLTSAYSEKIKHFTRRFCFFNLGDAQAPALIVVADDVEAADPSFKKYWQICSLKAPDVLSNGLVLHSEDNERHGKMFMEMLVPNDVDMDVRNGDKMNDIFGFKVKPPYPQRPEPNGTRVMFSPKKVAGRDRFLAVMQVAEGKAEKLPVTFTELPNAYQLSFKETTLLLASSDKPIETPCEFTVSNQAAECRVLVAGLKAGEWSIQGAGFSAVATVEEGRNTLFFVGKPGQYVLTPGKTVAKPLPDYTALVAPDVNKIPYRGIYLDGSKMEGVSCLVEKGKFYVPVRPLLEAVRLNYVADAKTLDICNGKAVFTAGSGEFRLNGTPLALSDKPKVVDGEWYLPAPYMACIVRRGLKQDTLAETVLFVKGGAFDDKIVWVESPTNPDFAKLAEMLRNGPDKRGYWDGLGKNATFTVTLKEEMPVDKVGIQFHQGSTRVARFAIEAIDAKGKVTRVFEGESDGKSNGLETFTFPAVPARQIRFVGFGNSKNLWNSVVTFVVGE